MDYDESELEKFFEEKPKSKCQKLFIYTSAITLFLIVIWFITPLFSDKEDELTFYEYKVQKYLLEDKGYEEKEIASIVEKSEIGGIPPSWVEVVFKNEPYVKYIYFAHSRVQQDSYSIIDEQNKGKITVEDLKNDDFLPN